jgi:hypothetical protein
LYRATEEERPMLESIRASVALPRVPSRALLSAGTVASFGWLLANDLIHPVVIYLFELYLSF